MDRNKLFTALAEVQIRRVSLEEEILKLEVEIETLNGALKLAHEYKVFAEYIAALSIKVIAAEDRLTEIKEQHERSTDTVEQLFQTLMQIRDNQ